MNMRRMANNGRRLALQGLSLLAALTYLPDYGQTLEEQAQQAAVADGVSTLGGLALGAAEANPLGLISVFAKIPMLAYVRTLPPDQQAEWHATYGAVWGGTAANNICIAVAILSGGVLAPLCPIVGMAWGMNKWNESAMERELWAICREERAYWNNPHMTCGFIDHSATAMSEVLKQSGAGPAPDTPKP
ncbi:MAG: hypothetical protein NDJ19_07400 [Ramlibacter sp.]|nr:hypothetical protein [Ramlibacter sp.]